MLYLPRTENNEMNFYSINPAEEFSQQMEAGEYGITVPKITQDKFDVNNIPENTLVIVPGLAFDKNGNRLGRGKGYYDIFLEKLLASPFKERLLGFVGFCYDFQIIDKVITEPTDVSMDYVISDKQILEVKAK